MDLAGSNSARQGREERLAAWESLTATGRVVPLLVAGGLTNGAVARRLYVSPHTVNTHLRHVFAKPGRAGPDRGRCRGFITRSSDVFAPSRQHHRPHAATHAATTE
jgi:DNA-binding CsgD family transcriptional regulator